MTIEQDLTDIAKSKAFADAVVELHAGIRHVREALHHQVEDVCQSIFVRIETMAAQGELTEADAARWEAHKPTVAAIGEDCLAWSAQMLAKYPALRSDLIDGSD